VSKGKFKLIFLLILTALIIFSAVFVYLDWVYQKEEIERRSLMMAETIATGLDGQMVRQLSASASDQGGLAYTSIKDRLARVREIDPNIRFAYLYLKRENKLYFLVDSEPRESEDYLPPGEEYTEADDYYFRPFVDGESLITEPVTDRWGSWVSVLAPLKNMQTGEVFAVLGLDYRSRAWTQSIFWETIKTSVFIPFLFILLLFIFFVTRLVFKIKKTGDLFNEMTQQSRTYIWEIDDEGKYIYVSDQIKDILGYESSELIGQKTVFDLHPEVDREKFKAEIFARFRNKQEIAGLENQATSKDDQVVWFLSSGKPVLNEFGKLTGYRGSSTDISKIKEVERLLRENQDKFQNLVSNVPGVVYRCINDENWTMQYISDHIKELSGYPAEDFINNKVRSYASIIHPDDADLVATEIREAINNNENWGIEYRVCDINGNIKWVSEQGFGLANQDGKVYFLDGIIVDITKQKQIQLELIESKKDLEKFKLAVDNASDHIVITDADGVCLYANDAAETITGFSKKEIIGKKVGTKENWGGYMPKEIYEKLWQTIKTDKKPYIGELKNKRKNGQEYEVRVSISPVLNENDEVIFLVGIERDITEEKIIDRQKTEFVSLASHQLKTPIGAIQWNLEMLLDGDYGKITSKQRKILTESMYLGSRMNELINALLNVSRLEMGVFIIEPKPTDFVELCDEVIKEMESKRADKEHEVTKNYQPDLPIIPADIKLLRIIFQNFISNAIKYTPSKGRITVTLKTDENNLIFEVANNGQPIPEADKDKIFDKMFRASNAQEQDPDGNGLGLYIVKQIVENAGGKIWFTSNEGEDTVFACSFPLSGMIPREGAKKLS